MMMKPSPLRIRRSSDLYRIEREHSKVHIVLNTGADGPDIEFESEIYSEDCDYRGFYMVKLGNIHVVFDPMYSEVTRDAEGAWHVKILAGLYNAE